MPQLLLAFLLYLATLSGTNAGSVVTVMVTDAASGRPVPGATVTAGEVVQLTAMDGGARISLPDLTGISIGVRAPGYARAQSVLEAGEMHKVSLAQLRPKAVYLSVYGLADRTLREGALTLQGRTSINALVIDIKGDRGQTPHPSKARSVSGAEAHAPGPVPRVGDLASLLGTLHARGLYLIARIVVFKDDPLALSHPEWAVRDATGNIWQDREELRWIDPTIKEAWAHNLDLAEEAARLGFDEIQFDYLRFPDTGGLVFSQPNTRANRVAAITGFLAAARHRLRPYNVFLAADIFGYVCWNLDDTAIGQQIETFDVSVDYISPMLYPSGFTWGLPGCRRPTEHPGEIVARSLAEAKRRTGLSGVRFRPWLQAFRDYAFDHRDFDADEIRQQVDAADAAGTNGWMLWNPRNRYDPDTLPR
ncbi:putative glycoside hydrolase [Cupriavidus sp. YR651]|uniref:putative glycoside hydrolase n=1 Tax=Cupriavidus sp. YR651 TaxID=1855315 RepID=UPI000B8154DA|nr:putative glycoside hydrolase [Cupriavidus sp. YR651]